MGKINAIITGIGGYVPDYILTNEELARMVDTSDEWITTRVGIKERRILTEEGLGTSYMARKAAKQLIQKTGVDPDTIDALIVTTTTPDYKFPSTASIVVGKLGLKNAFAFDFEAACCGFLYTLDVAASMIQSGRYKKIIVIGADKMSSLVDYTDRATCVLFGDGAGAVLVEATEEQNIGVQDSYLRTDGSGLPFLHMKAGGSVCPPSHFTVDHRLHFLYQEGRTVFRYAVTYMSNDVMEIMKRNYMELPHGLTLLVRGLTQMEGVLTQISPEISIIEIASNRMRQAMFQTDNLKKTLKSGTMKAWIGLRNLIELPTLAGKILRGYEKDQTRVHLELHADTELRLLLHHLVRNLVIVSNHFAIEEGFDEETRMYAETLDVLNEKLSKFADNTIRL